VSFPVDLTTLDPTTLAALMAAAFVAGFIDAIAGGGGLITVPALALGGLDPLAVLATNKLNGTFGSFAATWSFFRAGLLDLRRIWPVAVYAGAGALIGALALPLVPRAAIAAALPVALISIALYFALSPRMSDADAHRRMSPLAFNLTLLPAVGFYDAIFGPGTGSFFMMGFVGLAGYGVIRATAQTKLANFASNVVALFFYTLGGHIVWSVGLAMGVAQFAGSRLGARAAIRSGATLVRPLLISMCLALAIKLAVTPGQPLAEWLKHFWG
jgi:uncharacterized membrane protein YfcA